MSLQPGDLCEILSHPTSDQWKLVGKTVILICKSDLHQHSTYFPFWKCSGIPSNLVCSEKILRKIEPKNDEEDVQEEEELYA